MLGGWWLAFAAHGTSLCILRMTSTAGCDHGMPRRRGGTGPTAAGLRVGAHRRDGRHIRAGCGGCHGAGALHPAYAYTGGVTLVERRSQAPSQPAHVKLQVCLLCSSSRNLYGAQSGDTPYLFLMLGC